MATTPFSVCKEFCAGSGGKSGTTFTPHVSPEGVISWTNDGGLENPDPVTIKGDTPIKGVDYYTDEEKDTLSSEIETEVYNNVNPAPITNIDAVLTVNKKYMLNEVEELALVFPTNANMGDVIYLTFKSGATATNLTIDTTNTCDIEVIPETNTGYEIFGMFNGSIWIINYSEYTVSEV